MALPLPVSPLVIPDFGTQISTGAISPLGTDVEDRGSAYIHTPTKSTISRFAKYTELDVCDQLAYRVVNGAMTIQQNTPDCRTVLGGSVSVKVRVPFSPGSAADASALLQEMTDRVAIVAVG